MRRTRTIRALIGPPLWLRTWPPSAPVARVFIRVAFRENALVAALHQAKSTSAADTPVSFRGLLECARDSTCAIVSLLHRTLNLDTRHHTSVWR
jgi:hypothetical protein